MTNQIRIGTLGGMAENGHPLDPERNRRRLQILAELAGAKVGRTCEWPRRVRRQRLRELIAARRLAS
ncbi:hypothetical protein O7632_31540 [Solwaraspora sp. WMMD406]|uniref:hypothetical protein n=1 Tax=Solwaraspora sp. WMMD406 TaxID=3016095 RepID=UPI0024159F9B|nr:hypothetical protein [Solwaraspora sp. WMMD406]MDG4768591.1 hypothetical protein [Solwaraspora sp. WMMD406]